MAASARRPPHARGGELVAFESQFDALGMATQKPTPVSCSSALILQSPTMRDAELRGRERQLAGLGRGDEVVDLAQEEPSLSDNAAG
jgi:hypothetical protein